MDKIIDYFNNSNYIIDKNNLYNNVFLRSSFNLIDDKLFFHDIVALENDKIILNSNSYLLKNERIIWLNEKTKPIHGEIYNRIYNNINHIKENEIKIKNIYDKEHNYVLLVNPFSGTNIGHDTSIILNILENIIYNKINNLTIENTKFILHNEQIKSTPNILKIIKLIIPEKNIIYIDYDNIYFFKKIYIFEPFVFNIYTPKKLIENICSQINNMNLLNNEKKYENVLLVKKNDNNLLTSNIYSFTKESEELFVKNNYVFLNPKDDIFIIASQLLNAKRIITSTGAIAYFNCIFFNKNAEIIMLGGPYLCIHHIKFINLPTFNYKIDHLSSEIIIKSFTQS